MRGELMGNKDTRVAEGEWGQRQASGTHAKNVDLKKQKQNEPHNSSKR